MKFLHFSRREIGFGITAKGYIEPAFGVIAAQAIIAMAIQIDKKCSLAPLVTGMIKFLPQRIINVFTVIRGYE